MQNALENTDHLSLAEFCALADEEICTPPWSHPIEWESANAFHSVYDEIKPKYPEPVYASGRPAEYARLYQSHKTSKALAIVLFNLSGSELLRAKIAHNLI